MWRVPGLNVMWSRNFSSGGRRLVTAWRPQPVGNRQFNAFGTASVNGAITASNASPPLVTI
jgi:hypothetical protein